MKQYLKLTFVVLFVCFLSACVSLKTSSDKTRDYKYIQPAQRQSSLAKIKHWQSDGAFSLQYANNKNVISSFSWRQTGKSVYDLTFASSLDAYVIRLKKNYGNVVLYKTATKYYSASTPEALMLSQLGWSVPISNLYYWIRGIPAPGKFSATYDKFGHLQVLHQQGWNIQFSKYQQIDIYDLPEVMLLNTNMLKLKIVIKHWLLPMHTPSLE